MIVRRVLVAASLLAVGVLAGFMGAAAALRGWLASRGESSSDELSAVAIFDSFELTSASAAFRGGSVLAWFGGAAIDLTGATLAPGARLDVGAIFGGVAIAVPATWRIEADASGLIGGVDVPVPAIADPDAPLLVVRARSIMGGISIRPRTR